MSYITAVNLPVISDQASLSRYINEIKKFPSLEFEDEQELAKRMIDQKDVKAAQSLILSHLKLVVKIAMSYKGYGLPMLEVISEGNLGLMQAVKKFNPELGYRLSTYATWWIKANIQEYIIKSWSLVKIGTTVAQKKLFFNLRKLKSRINKLEGREMNSSDVAQIAHQLNVEESEVLEMNQRMMGADISLNRYITNDDKVEAIDFIPEPRPNQEAIVAAKEMHTLRLKLFKTAMEKLDDREQEIINKRYLAQPQLTLEELAKQFTISTERVRQIEEKAIKKLKELVRLSHDSAA